MAKDYQSYREWKDWDGRSEAPEFQLAYFERETERAGLRPPARLLEVGFGNGEFLRWARGRGFEVTGWEIIPELVGDLRADGFEVAETDLAAEEFEPGNHAGRFDGIVALDVVEHLEVEASIRFLRNTAALLREGGRVLLRFPNGGSPFGLPLQNGDHTHRQALTESKLRQLAIGTGLRLVEYGNTTRKIDRRSKSAWIRPALFVVRDLVECIVGYLYFGRRLPLDKSCVAILEKEVAK